MLLRRMLLLSATLSLFLGLGGGGIVPARAEGGTCPPGYYPINSPGVMGCAPIPDYDGSDESDEWSPPQPEWESRWGATVMGGGGFGASSNQRSKKQARKLAKQECLKNNGGKGCDDVSWYANQCVAVAGGQQIAVTMQAPERAEAERLAVADCNLRDRECTVLYAACSFPVRVR